MSRSSWSGGWGGERFASLGRFVTISCSAESCSRSVTSFMTRDPTLEFRGCIALKYQQHGGLAVARSRWLLSMEISRRQASKYRDSARKKNDNAVLSRKLKLADGRSDERKHQQVLDTALSTIKSYSYCLCFMLGGG